MKKGILSAITLLMFVFLITIMSADKGSTIVSADKDTKTDEENVIVNDRGIKMTQGQYDLFVSMFGVDEVMAMDQGMFDSYKDIDYRVWEPVEPIAWVGTLTTYDEDGKPIDITMTKEECKKIIEKRGND